MEKNRAMRGSRSAPAFLFVFFIVVSVWAGSLIHEQSAATGVVSFNSHSFLINGTPAFVFGGQIENCRIPLDQWRDRLLRVKMAGYNTITTYVFWSAYEPNPGEFHFEDNLNLDAWLTLAESLGLYVFIRVGPYDCAEWDLGGFPTCYSGQNLSMRTSDATSLAHVDEWWGKLFPIIMKHQIHKGGSIIFVQLENEYESVSPQDAAYLSHLETKAKSLGMEVPYLFSGENHGFAPDPPVFSANTWMSTEVWTPKDDFLHFYGPPDNPTLSRMEHGTWKMCATGGAGFSHYMVDGGTNFGYVSCGCVPGENGYPTMTTYDMMAPIAETGLLRPEYFLIKRAGLLMQSFNHLIAGSTNGASLIDAPASGLSAYVNTNPQGKIAFVENTGSSAASVSLKFKNKSAAIPTQGPISLPPGRFCHFLADYVMSSGDTIDYLAAGILSQKNMGQTTYIVCYGSGGAKGELSLHCSAAPPSPPPSPWLWTASSRQAKLFFTYPPTDSIAEYSMALGNGKTLTMLVMDTAQADLTWILDSSIVSGPQFVTDSTMEFAMGGGKAFVYSKSGKSAVAQQAVTAPGAISLANMQWSSAAAEADTAFNDSSWTASAQPQSMDGYGYSNGYGWYRTTYTAAAASSQTLALPTIKDVGIVFWNGKVSGTTVQVKAGKNVLAILVGQFGRDKLFAFAGPIGGQAKGIVGQVKLGSTVLANWKFKGGLNGLTESPTMGTPTNWNSFLSRTWTSGNVPSDNTPRFFKADFTYSANASVHQTFRLTSGSISRGVAWINGHNLGRVIENMSSFAPPYVPECWLRQSNTLVVLSQIGQMPQNVALTPQETYSVKSTSSTGVTSPALVRAIGVTPLSFARSGGIVVDMKGRVVSRAAAGLPLETLARSVCSPGIYLIYANGTARRILVDSNTRRN